MQIHYLKLMVIQSVVIIASDPTHDNSDIYDIVAEALNAIGSGLVTLMGHLWTGMGTLMTTIINSTFTSSGWAILCVAVIALGSYYMVMRSRSRY